VQKKSQNASGQAGAFRTAMTAPLDAAQMQAFEDDGAVLVDLRLSSDLLDRAEAAWDRLAKAGTSTPHSILEDRDFVELISAPVFEEIAKQVLRSDRVFILETGAAGTGLERAEAKERALREDWPEKHGIRSEWANSMHIDVQVTTEDFEAMPRREHLAIWFWLNNVPAERAAMRVLKGSHKPLGAHWQEMQRRWKRRTRTSCCRCSTGRVGRQRASPTPARLRSWSPPRWPLPAATPKSSRSLFSTLVGIQTTPSRARDSTSRGSPTE
jgi:hypothetical protein